MSTILADLERLAELGFPVQPLIAVRIFWELRLQKKHPKNLRAGLKVAYLAKVYKTDGNNVRKAAEKMGLFITGGYIHEKDGPRPPT